jgi:L-amino acid N-acyltransferase
MSILKQKVKIRNALLTDLPYIVNIHNDIIREGGLTADMTPYTLDEKRSWFEDTILEPYFIQVLEVNELVYGFVYVSPWRNGRAALRHVAEISYYLAKPFRGLGYGRQLLNKGIHLAKQNGFKTLLTLLLDSNVPSISLLESEGFHVAGHLPEVAELADSVAGQYIMIKKLY